MSHSGLLQQVAQQDIPRDHEIQGGLLGAVNQQVVSPEVTQFGLSGADTQPEQALGLLELIAQKGVGK